MVTTPTASTFDTALPEIMPNRAEPTTAIFAAPPVRASTWPRIVNGMTISTAT